MALFSETSAGLILLQDRKVQSFVRIYGDGDYDIIGFATVTSVINTPGLHFR